MSRQQMSRNSFSFYEASSLGYHQEFRVVVFFRVMRHKFLLEIRDEGN